MSQLERNPRTTASPLQRRPHGTVCMSRQYVRTNTFCIHAVPFSWELSVRWDIIQLVLSVPLWLKQGEGMFMFFPQIDKLESAGYLKQFIRERVCMLELSWQLTQRQCSLWLLCWGWRLIRQVVGWNEAQHFETWVHISALSFTCNLILGYCSTSVSSSVKWKEHDIVVSVFNIKF